MLDDLEGGHAPERRVRAAGEPREEIGLIHGELLLSRARGHDGVRVAADRGDSLGGQRLEELAAPATEVGDGPGRASEPARRRSPDGGECPLRFPGSAPRSRRRDPRAEDRRRAPRTPKPARARRVTAWLLRGSADCFEGRTSRGAASGGASFASSTFLRIPWVFSADCSFSRASVSARSSRSFSSASSRRWLARSSRLSWARRPAKSSEVSANCRRTASVSRSAPRSASRSAELNVVWSRVTILRTRNSAALSGPQRGAGRQNGRDEAPRVLQHGPRPRVRRGRRATGRKGPRGRSWARAPSRKKPRATQSAPQARRPGPRRRVSPRPRAFRSCLAYIKRE